MLKLEFLFNSFVLFSLVHIQCLGSLLEYLFLSVFFQILLGSVQRNHTDKCNGCLSESCFWQFRKNTKVLFISNTGALISVEVFIVLNTQGDLPWEAQMCLVQTLLGKSNDSWGGCDPILCAHTGRAEQAKPALVVPVSASSKDWQGAHEHTTAVSQAAQCEMHSPTALSWDSSSLRAPRQSCLMWFFFAAVVRCCVWLWASDKLMDNASVWL